jgi:hypothetical protein
VLVAVTSAAAGGQPEDEATDSKPGDAHCAIVAEQCSQNMSIG